MTYRRKNNILQRAAAARAPSALRIQSLNAKEHLF
jgi:hypothetical protein